MYDNIHDAEMRLHNTVIRFLGRPVLVASVFHHASKIWLSLVDCITDEEKKIPLDNPGINFAAPPLGFISYITSYGRSYVYAYRMPARRQQQGLALSRLVLTNPLSGGIVRHILSVASVGHCIMACYEDAEEDYQALIEEKKDKRLIVPFSRDLAATSRNLYYKTSSIGDIKHKDGIHTVQITSPSFSVYPFKEVFNANWRFVRA